MLEDAVQERADTCTSAPPSLGDSPRTGEAGEAGGRGLPALLAVQRREADQRADAAQAGVRHPEAAAQLQLLQPAQAAQSRQLLPCAFVLSRVSHVASLAIGWLLAHHPFHLASEYSPAMLLHPTGCHAMLLRKTSTHPVKYSLQKGGQHSRREGGKNLAPHR